MNLTTKRNNWFLGNNGHLSWLSIWLVFSLITIAVFVYSYPTQASIEFLFFDTGAGLKVDDFISKGYTPNVDFSYPYGLLPLVIGHIWYEIFGRTPHTFFLLELIFRILSVAVLARIAILANLRILGVVFLALTIPFSFCINWNLTHVMEPFFICLALSEQLAGRKRNTLVVLILGWFTKPSMSIIYIFWILVLYIRDIFIRKVKFTKTVYELLPSAIVLISTSFIMSILFGLKAVYKTLIPLEVAKFYHGNNMGFFNEGKDFWNPYGAKITYYFGTATGLWIILTLLLILSVIYLYYKKIKGKLNSKLNQLVEVQLTILCLHLSFIFLFFGIQSSWGYYSYLLPIGVSFLASQYLAEFKNLHIFLLSIIIAITIMAYKFTFLGQDYKAWISTKQQESIVGLWSTEAQKEEITKLIDSCKYRNTLIYDIGAFDLFFPKCNVASAFYPTNHLNSIEQARINKQFDSAQQVVMQNSFFPPLKAPIWDQIKQKFAEFEFDHKDTMFTYLKRKS